MATVNMNYRNIILSRLQERKAKEAKLQEVIATTSILYEKIDLLEFQNAKLKARQEAELFSGESRGESTLERELQKQVYNLQAEVANLHRTKSEHAQSVIDMKKEIEEKERKIANQQKSLLELDNTLSLVRTENAQLKDRISHLNQTLETLKDEHAAQLMQLNSLEEKCQKLEKENIEYVERILTYKAKDVNDLNAECERYHRMRQAKVQKELEDATKETVHIAPPKEDLLGPIINSTLPSGMLYKFEAHDGEVNAVKWSEGFLATGGGDRKIKMWKLQNNQVTPAGVLIGCNAPVMCIDFSPGAESMVLGASYDHATRLWTVPDWRLRQTLTGHSNHVMAARFFGDSITQVVSGSHDRTLKIWDLRSITCINTAFVGSSCNDVVVNSSSFISAHIDRKIRFWDARRMLPSQEIQFQGKVTSLDLSHDFNYLLCCVRDDTLKYLDLRENKVVRTFSHENFKVGCDWTRAKISPDGQYVAAGSNDGSLIIWNALTGKVEKTFREHKSTVIACTWNPSGDMIISTEKSKRAIIWSSIS